MNPDDRVLVFFAGHGETITGNRGEVGYLVPVDGDCDKLATLIRWDELTRNADLMPAKHVLFIMDACYGGLAVKRHVSPGSRRFLKDMLRRYSRQVLTAGKADEMVADEGGPRPGHSIFTGHFLDGLDGAAASRDGIVTANGVMAYVYDRVATDHHSDQTPHYGFIDGDGDFIFSIIPPAMLAEDEKKGGTDVVIEVPAALIDQSDPTSEEEQVSLLKEYLSEPRYRIKLDDMVNASVRATILQTAENKFPLSTSSVTGAEFINRLKNYEEAIKPLLSKTVLLGKWALSDQRSTLTNLLARLSDNNSRMAGGNTLWIGLRWYPISFLMYSAGIAALSVDNYDTLAAIHTTRVDASMRRGDRSSVELILPVVDGMLDVAQTNAWKCTEEYKQKYTPESEHLFKALQPALEDVLFLGASYEKLFDRFEILRALVYADLTEGGWGPVGRFGWKYTSRMSNNSPYAELRAEAALKQDEWPPLKVGLFRGSFTRFDEVAKAFEAGLLNRLQWF